MKLTTREAAEYLGIPERRVRALGESGRLSRCGRKRNWYYRPEDVERLKSDLQAEAEMRLTSWRAEFKAWKAARPGVPPNAPAVEVMEAEYGPLLPSRLREFANGMSVGDFCSLETYEYKREHRLGALLEAQIIFMQRIFQKVSK